MNLKRIATLAPIVAATLLSANVRAQSLPGWSLLWSDEFTQADGTLPDTTKWGYDIGGAGWGNDELQYYTNRSENARILGDQLVIEARAENYGGKNYTSARLLTKGKAAWTFGRLEARIKLPRGQGIWPAFWMLGANIDSVGWPNCGEIDIMETIGREPSTLYGTVHGPGYSGSNGISGNTVLSGAALADAFHVYAIEWELNRITWYLDGVQYFTLTPANLPSGSTWVFNQPQYMMLNLAVGGRWPGNPDGTTVFPQRMLVDYVRVYTPAAGANHAINPGFETVSPLSWTPQGPNVSQQSATSHTGVRSLKVFGSFSGSANESGVFQQRTAFPGDSFSSAAWLFSPVGDKIAGANTAWMEVSFRDAGSNTLALFRSPVMDATTVAGSWQNFVVSRQVNPATGALINTVTTLIAPAGTATVRSQLVFRQPAMAGGSVWFDDISLMKNVVAPPPQWLSVTVDPAETWLGHMNVSELPANGGAFLYGVTWIPADLTSSFTGNTLTLSPNSMGDTGSFWYSGGNGTPRTGQKIMGANFYVEKHGSLSGKSVIFSGRVSANTFTPAHQTVAFIRDFSADYSTSQRISVPLTNGVFSIKLTTLPNVDRHVQYGFETTGVNVWATDVVPFGNLQIAPFISATYDSWINSQNFAAFQNPDLAPLADPDGDGQSNLTEFALDGNPAAADSSTNLLGALEGSPEDPFLQFTLPVLEGAVFSGPQAKTASIGALSYTIEGSRNLTAYHQEIMEVNPPSAQGMPALHRGWAYRTFRLVNPPGGPDSSGFMRATFTSNPF